ncbi:MAG: lipopolysaccharide assembly protein LapA domain-containing protein [Candidatus Aminicenantes bacterium]|nr:lipopolysaccharide assembly protein LapA domain-containing protein [Candidatus Aminicenantes bacterium]
MTKKTKLIGLGLGGLFLIIALLQNRGMVEFHFLFWKMSVSEVILIPILLLIGFVLGLLAGRRSK